MVMPAVEYAMILAIVFSMPVPEMVSLIQTLIAVDIRQPVRKNHSMKTGICNDNHPGDPYGQRNGSLKRDS
jgi:hypothetical protein